MGRMLAQLRHAGEVPPRRLKIGGQPGRFPGHRAWPPARSARWLGAAGQLVQLLARAARLAEWCGARWCLGSVAQNHAQAGFISAACDFERETFGIAL